MGGAAYASSKGVNGQFVTNLTAAGIEAADPETTRVLEGVVKTLHHALTRLSSEIEPV